jgi:hypothetical protein
MEKLSLSLHSASTTDALTIATKVARRRRGSLCTQTVGFGRDRHVASLVAMTKELILEKELCP